MITVCFVRCRFYRIWLTPSEEQSPALQPDVYMRASEKQLNVYGQELAFKRGLTAVRTNSKGELRPWDWMALLLASERRVVELMRNKVRMIQSETDDQPSFYLYNLSQTVQFQLVSAPLKVWPALLRSSRYWVDKVYYARGALRFEGRLCTHVSIWRCSRFHCCFQMDATLQQLMRVLRIAWRAVAPAPKTCSSWPATECTSHLLDA